METKIPDVSYLVKKTGYNTKVTEIENKLINHNQDKYIDTEISKLAADVFNARLAQANFITKTDFDAKLSSLNRKITENKQKVYLLKMNWISWKLLAQAMLLARVIFKKMVHKII